MNKIDELKSKSKSESELVFSFQDAIDFVDLSAQESIKILGWEGWIKFNNGKITHSQQHQGTCGMHSNDSIKTTIIESFEEWLKSPEAKNAELLFCITTSA